MIALRRNTERRHIRSGNCDMWLSFYPEDHAGTLIKGFGILSIFNEMQLPSGEDAAPKPIGETELITYVYKGALAQEDSTERAGVISAGEFQCMTIGRVFRHRVTNASPTDLAHFFRIYLHLLTAEVMLDYTDAQMRFTAAQRRNVLCTVASPDGRNGSLCIHPDAHIYSSILDPGQHIVHELLQGRIAWVHIVYGTGTVNGIDLTPGDGVGVTNEPSVSLTVKENTELLLIDTIPND